MKSNPSHHSVDKTVGQSNRVSQMGTKLRQATCKPLVDCGLIWVGKALDSCRKDFGAFGELVDVVYTEEREADVFLSEILS